MDFQAISVISIATAFLQGILCFASPCVLPLLPVYFAYLSGGNKTDDFGNVLYDRKKLIVNTIFFAFGIGIVFFVLGLGATAFGKFIVKNRALFSILGGVLIIFFAAIQLGFFGANIFQKEKRFSIKAGKLKSSPFAAILFGMAFSFSWTPCVGPALASILVMSSDVSTKTNGMILILFYTLGFALPFVISGIFVSSMLNFLKKHRNIVKWTTKIGGIMLLGIGLFMIVNGFLSINDVNKRNNANKSNENKIENPKTELESANEQKYPNAIGFSLLDQYGNQWTLSELKGKTVILNFWATWCPPCVREMPYFQLIYDELIDSGNEDIFILGIASPNFYREKDIPDIIKFLNANEYDYPCLMDIDGIISGKYYVSAFPTTFLINREGQIQKAIVGGLSEERLRKLVYENE